MGCGCSKSALTIGNDNESIGSRCTTISESGYLSKTTVSKNYITLGEVINSDNPEINGYKFIAEIGKGAMSVVYKITNQSGAIYAAKAYDNARISKPSLTGDDPFYVSVQNEINIMSKLDHLYIISLIDAFNDELTNNFIMVIPYTPIGSFYDCLDRLNKTSIIACFHQIASAMQYAHEAGVVHRDLKPENFLVFDENYFVLSDFSAAIEVGEGEEIDDIKGSPAFFSPEECAGEPFDPKPSDVWAFGVSLYWSFFRSYPFGINEAEGLPIATAIYVVSQKTQECNLTFPYESDFLLVDLLKKILRKDPTERLTFKQIVDHNFFDPVREIDEINREEDAILSDP